MSTTGATSGDRQPAGTVLVCDTCGATTSDPQAFAKLRVDRRPSARCPSCLDRNARRAGRASVAAVLGVVGLGLALRLTGNGVVSTATHRLDVAGALLLIGGIYLATFVHVVPHELGHAVVGRLVGFRVPRVVIGVGAPLLERRIGRTWFDLRTFPVSGFTIGATSRRALLRTRLWLFTVAGPLASLAVTLLAYRVASTTSDDPLGFVATCLFDGGLLVLFCSLFPSRPGGMPSDGLSLLTTPFLDDARLDAIVEHEDTTDLREHLRRHEHDEAIAVAARQAERQDDAASHLLLVLSLIEAERWAEVVAATRDHLARFEPAAPERAIHLNNIAWAGIVDPDVVTRAEADRTSAEAYELAPWSHEVLGTRGSVLVELGDPETGIELLEASILPSHPPATLACTHAYLAIAGARSGNQWAARAHLDRARAVRSAPGTAASTLTQRAIDEVATAETAATIRTGWAELELPDGSGPPIGDPDPADPRAAARIAARQPDELVRVAAVVRHAATNAAPERLAALVTAGLGRPLAQAEPAAWLAAAADALEAAHRARRATRR